MSTTVTAQMVNTLRQKTGVAMGKCKEALLASEGDQSKAEHWLRVQLPSHKPTEKVSGEGVVVLKSNEASDSVTIVELACDTDFTAKNAQFIAGANKIADLWATNAPAVESVVAELRMLFKENIFISHAETWSVAGGKFGTYTHSNNKLTVAVSCFVPEGIRDSDKVKELLKGLAMHIAGTNPSPVAIDRASMHHELIDTERKVIEGQFNADPKNAKKPAEIKEKIITGKLNRFFQEKTLLEQPYVKDDTKTVGQVITEVDSGIKVARFLRRQVGDPRTFRV